MKNPVTAQRLRAALENANMTQKELAEKTGLTKGAISQYVNGTYAPGNVKATMMADVLHVHPMWLMGFDQETIDMQKSIKSDPLDTLSDEKKSLITEIVKEMSTLTPDELSEIKNQINYIIFKRNN